MAEIAKGATKMLGSDVQDGQVSKALIRRRALRAVSDKGL